MNAELAASARLAHFMEGPVIKNDTVLKRLIHEADNLEGSAIVVHNFVQRDILYIGWEYAEQVGYTQNKFFDGGFRFMVEITDPLDMPRLTMLQSAYVQQAKGLDFDPRTVVIQNFHWSTIHRNGSKVPARVLATTLTYSLQHDFELCIGIYLLSGDVANSEKTDQYSLLLRQIKERHNEVYLHPVREELVSPYPLNYAYDFERITVRERDVLGMLAKGRSTIKIGELLGISENTVERHRKNLLEKFEAKNSAELISKASKMFWLD
jgi:DNA-binding CsgD family transcriptional regulator